MNAFELLVPKDKSAALGLLNEHGDEARLIAGGTGLLNLMKQRLVYPERLISLHRVGGMDAVTLDGASVRIGALTRLATLEGDPAIATHLPMLRETLHEVASPRVRAMATLGGAVAHGDPHQDTPAALIALGASVIAESHDGSREIPLDELYQDYYETALEADELITEIRIPQQRTRAAAYLKFLPRSAEDYATVAAAVSIEVDDASGVCSGCRIVLGSVGSTPIRSTAAETLLIGERPSTERFRAAAEAAARDTDPMTDTRGSAEYKRAMAAVFTRRALTQALERLGQADAG
ncbi:MAG: xanthine dehydrogenase family protein subunit M [Gammaproteobacteria bacterium]|nr:xanthine dehydrogenase family protein subunit M [Gammaproteobacteria bacterium]